MVRRIKNKKAATLIEVIVTMTTLSVIALAVGIVLIYILQEFIYLPRQLKVRQVGQAMLDDIAEGTQPASGLRFAKAITGATASRVDYTYGYPMTSDQHAVTLRWDNPTKKVYKSVDSGAEAAIPYYSVGTSVQGKTISTTVFTYYKADGSVWTSGVDALNIIKRVQVDINTTTGAGSFASYDGSLNMSTSIEIKQY